MEHQDKCSDLFLFFPELAGRGYCGIIADTNECDSSPCIHNGTCSNLENRYRCTCKRGFTGINCETGNIEINSSFDDMIAHLSINE